MILERVRETQRAVNRAPLQLELACARCQLEVLAVCVNRRVTRGRCFLMRTVLVRRALVFVRRVTEVAVLEKQVRELVVNTGRLVIGREGHEVLPGTSAVLPGSYPAAHP